MDDLSAFIEKCIALPWVAEQAVHKGYLREEVSFQRVYSLYNKSYEDSASFLSDLIAPVFEGFDQWETGYGLEHKNKDGSVIAERKGLRKLLKAGEYILQSEFKENKRVERVSFKSFASSFDPTFFHFFGNNKTEYFPRSLLRFYLNIKPEFLIDFLKFFRKEVEEASFFIHIKTDHLASVNRRADNTVFYLHREDTDKFMGIIRSFISGFPFMLNPELPYFVLKITDSLGFAENPEDPNESFGSLRCKIISRLVYEAKTGTVQHRTKRIMKQLEKEGFDLQKFYLNPYSEHRYDFKL